MGCFSSKSRAADVRPEAKWDYISLKDFKSNSCFTVFAYVYLHFSLLLSMAVYGVDSFTAVNLLAFDKWTSQVKATSFVSFDVIKIVFSVCIILSFINLTYEHIRARRVMNRGSVAESFLDNLAVRLESVRWGGQGWRRFLVFAELTKSKKGAEYVALFTYFSFQSWIRVIFCSGPRQVLNALTLYNVFTNSLIPTETGSVDKSIMNFFSKLENLAKQNTQQVVVLSGMIFTLIVWVITLLSLLVAVLFYIFFLWHYIPRQDGGLSGYCSRKINKRLMRIVSVKVNKAIAKEERDRLRAELKAAKKSGEKTPIERQAKLPTFMDPSKDDSLPEMPKMGLSRTETMTTLPVYESRPGTPNTIEMSAFDQKRPLPSRQGTGASYASNAPLMGSAAPMSINRTASPAPTLPQIDFENYPPQRPGTAQSNRSYGGPQQRPMQNNNPSFGPRYTQSPAPYGNGNMPPPQRSLTGQSMDPYGRPPMPRAVDQLSGRPQMYDDNASIRDGRSSPAPSMYSNAGPPGPNRPGFNGPGYLPPRSATNPPPQQRGQMPPQRNMTAPMPPMQQSDPYGPRPGTSQSQRGPPRGYGYGDVEAQRGPPRY
ncbi:vacuolar membrane protein [Apiospora arundinis]|uniref:Vacuolar membrane protein n=1 Tax=Apiospora arundinis TaxID=335852 RepID=A0ABR2JM73_9PEZI